jgi:hypothetical protein
MEWSRKSSVRTYGMASSVLHANTWILRHLDTYDWAGSELREAAGRSGKIEQSDVRTIAYLLLDALVLFGTASVSLIDQFGWTKEAHYIPFVNLLVLLKEMTS